MDTVLARCLSYFLHAALMCVSSVGQLSVTSALSATNFFNAVFSPAHVATSSTSRCALYNSMCVKNHPGTDENVGVSDAAGGEASPTGADANLSLHCL